MRYIFTLLTILCTCSYVARAQDSMAKKRFEDFSQKSKKTYVARNEKNRIKFVSLHDKAWERLGKQSPITLPLDEHRPVVVYDNEPLKNRKLPYESLIVPQIKKDPQPQSKPQPRPQPVPRPEPTPAPVPSVSTISFDMYGTQVAIRVPENAPFKLHGVTRTELDGAWKNCHDSFQTTLDDCLRYGQQMNLCDWAYMKMLDKLTTSYLGIGNDATLMMSFLFMASGYKTALAINEPSIYLLFGSDNSIYGKDNVVVKGGTFYGWADKLPSSMNVAELSTEGCRNISLALDSTPSLAKSYSEPRQLISRYGMTASVKVNRNLVEYYDGYPQSFRAPDFMTRWAIYANTPMERDIADELYPELRGQLDEDQKTKSVQKLLDFVQTAFKYEYDDKVWGYDRPFFAEESLFYDFCDCEDRSILFSRLVRDLVGTDVLLVYYPGHLATAVKLEGEPEGDFFELPDGRYTVCDPTYIGAPIGLTMPDMDNSKAKLILLKR